MTNLEDIIITDEYGEIQIWSQDKIEYFIQDIEVTENE